MSGFDYEKFLALLPSRQLRTDVNPKVVYSFRKWSWKILKSYNGFSGEERARGWQAVRWLQAAGVMPENDPCDICGETEKPRDYHSEDYYNILSAAYLCKRCHSAIHTRFKNPDNLWHILQTQRTSPVETWYDMLLNDEHGMDLAAHQRAKYGPDVQNLMKSPIPAVQYPQWLTKPMNGQLHPLPDPVQHVATQDLPPPWEESREAGNHVDKLKTCEHAGSDKPLSTAQFDLFAVPYHVSVDRLI